MKVLLEGNKKELRRIQDQINRNLDAALARGEKIITVRDLVKGTPLDSWDYDYDAGFILHDEPTPLLMEVADV